MKKLLNILFILSLSLLFACGDEVAEWPEGMQVRSKKYSDEDTFKYEYVITDRSSTGGNTIGQAGDFTLYSGSEFHIGDVIVFSTKEDIEELATLREESVQIKQTIANLKAIFDQTQSLADSLETVVISRDSVIASELNTEKLKLEEELEQTKLKLGSASTHVKLLSTFQSDIKKLTEQ